MELVLETFKDPALVKSHYVDFFFMSYQMSREEIAFRTLLKMVDDNGYDESFRIRLLQYLSGDRDISRGTRSEADQELLVSTLEHVSKTAVSPLRERAIAALVAVRKTPVD